MVTVNTFGVIFLNMSLMVELYLRQPVPCLFKRNNFFYLFVIRLDPDVTFTAFNWSFFSFVTVFAEIVEYNHFRFAHMADLAFILVLLSS